LTCAEPRLDPVDSQHRLGLELDAFDTAGPARLRVVVELRLLR
jgi:hypothetical protein